MKKALLILLIAGSPVAAADAELRKTATAVRAKRGDTLARVRMLILHRTLYEKKEIHKSEHQVEVTGTVIGDDGLVVISASSLDFLPEVPVGPALQEEVRTSEIERKKAHLIFADGKEIAAEFLGRDRKHDLAFLRPIEKRTGLAHLPLVKATSLATADEAIVLYPLTRLLQRRPAVMMRSIAAVCDKRAVLDSSELRLLGCPVFTASGEFAGIAATLRPAQAPHEFLSNFENLEPDIVIIDPATLRTAADNVQKK